MLISYFIFIGTLFLLGRHDNRVRGEDNILSAPLDESGIKLPSHITVTSWNDMPYSGLKEENGKWIGTGYAFYLFNLISSKLNFTYTIVPPKEHILGDENSGIMGLLYEKKVDMAVAFIPVLPEMRRYCTFSAALDETTLTAVMKRPHESATGSGLLAPFENTVWLLLLASLIFVGPTIYIFAHIRAKLWHDPHSENFGLSSCFWFVYSSLMKQGTNIAATSDSTRMLFATWWIFILILTSFYTANLTAFLTKPQFTLSISSLEDIVHKGYSWISYKGRTVDFLLSQDHPNDLSLLNISKWQGKSIFQYYEPTRAILESVSTSKLFLADVHYLQTLIFKDYVNKTLNHVEHGGRCAYVIMPGGILITNRAFGFAHGSPVRKQVNKLLIRLIESGIVQRGKKGDLPLAEICPVDLRSTERQLRNSDLLLTYKVVIAGYTIAAIALLCEIIYSFISFKMRQGKGTTHGCLPHCASKENTETQTNGGTIDRNYDSILKYSPRGMFQDQNGPLGKMNQHIINGRSYHVIIDPDGEQRLIPIRTPSAFLFQYRA